MLEAAKGYKVTFALMGEEDLQYVGHFYNDLGGRLSNVDHDWDFSIFVDFLRHFYEITIRFLGSLYITSNNFYQHISEIKKLMDKIYNNDNPLLGVWKMSWRLNMKNTGEI